MKIAFLNSWIYLISFATSAFITLVGIPLILRVAKSKNIFDEPNYRSSHSTHVPRLGGIVIFIASVLGLTMWLGDVPFPELASIVAALIILFFAGVKDDIVGMKPWTKLSMQVLSALLLSLGGKLRIESFYGLFGLESIPFFLTICLTVLVVVFIINAFNLIDGIDGLAAGLGIIVSFTFAVVFYVVGEYNFVMLAFSLIGSLGTFLFFNFSKKWKIFMGDTGSMILGLFVSIMALKFLNLNNKISLLEIGFSNLPFLTILILFIPIFDTLRVFLIRLYLGKSPFRPDKNHLHHILLKKVSQKHSKVSIIMYSLNIAPILLGFFVLKSLSLIEASVLFFAYVSLYILCVQILVDTRKKDEVKSLENV